MLHLVIGASLKPYRYSNLAIKSLKKYGYHAAAVGLRSGEVEGVKIETERKNFRDVDTILLYLNPDRQKELYDYLIGLKPRRIIFNPGTENAEFEEKARKSGIETVEACSLVLLTTGQY